MHPRACGLKTVTLMRAIGKHRSDENISRYNAISTHPGQRKECDKRRGLLAKFGADFGVKFGVKFCVKFFCEVLL
jgi:hypothetical protein